MEKLTFRHTTKKPLAGARPQAITASWPPATSKCCSSARCRPDACTVEIETPINGYGDVWEAVVADFVERRRPAACASPSTTGGPPRHRVPAPPPGRPADGGLT